MTTRLRAHFDGKVLVPDEPVDLPVGEPLELTVCGTQAQSSEPAPPDPKTLAELADWIESLPPLPPGTLPRDGAAQHDHYLYGTPKRP
ncbi:MAG: hypothetical protein WD042_17185 [Phycisphaeraceae bacterium]